MIAQARANSRVSLTPKAFANFSPGLERSDNPGSETKSLSTLKAFGMCGNNPFRVQTGGVM